MTGTVELPQVRSFHDLRVPLFRIQKRSLDLWFSRALFSQPQVT